MCYIVTPSKPQPNRALRDKTGQETRMAYKESSVKRGDFTVQRF